MPNAMDYQDLRKNLAAVMDRVVEDCDVTIITRQGGKAVVLMPLEEYNSLQETACLLSTPENARRLLEGMENVQQGNLVEHPLLDCEGE